MLHTSYVTKFKILSIDFVSQRGLIKMSNFISCLQCHTQTYFPTAELIWVPKQKTQFFKNNLYKKNFDQIGKWILSESRYSKFYNFF